MRDVLIGSLISILGIVMACGALLALVSNFVVYDPTCSRIGFAMFVVGILGLCLTFSIIEKPKPKHAQ